MPVVVLAAWMGCLQAGLTASASGGQAAPAVRLDRSRYMGVDQIKRGMTGIGRTVLKDAELSEFKATVVDVMRNWAPKQHVILVRCTGANLEHSGIIRGMSGSPIYLQDPLDGGKLKMIGAIAYGWRWNKDPIGGVQAIEQMLAVEGFRGKGKAAASKKTRTGRAGHGAGRIQTELPGKPNRDADSRYAMVGFTAPVLQKRSPTRHRTDRFGDLEPLMTPLMVGGGNRAAMAYLTEQLEGTRLAPVRVGAAGQGNGGAAPDKLVPGGSLVIPYLIGDIDMAGVGTVTEVVGNRILGFGHSMTSEGPVELPMATGRVHTAIPMLSASFKLASVGKLVGTLTGDEETGVCGVVGPVARMIPVKVAVHDPHGTHAYRYQAMHHREMTPWIIGAGLMMSVLAHRDLPEEHTIRHELSVEYEKLGRFAVANVSSMRSLWEVRSDLTEPMSMLMDNQFGRARVTGIETTVTVEAKASAMSMERVELIRSRFKPGETVEVAIRWRPYRAEPFVRRYTMQLPTDLPDGAYELQVGSGRSHLMGMRMEKPHLFRAESMADMMSAVRRIGSVRMDRVYMRLRIKRGGLAIGKTEMPELPSFRRQIFNEAKLRAVASYAEPIVVEHPVPFVVSGEQRFAITVDRRADQ